MPPAYDGVDPALPWWQRVNQPATSSAFSTPAGTAMPDPARAAGGAHFSAPRVRGRDGIWSGDPIAASQSAPPEAFTTSRSGYAIAGHVDPAQVPGGVHRLPTPDDLAAVVRDYGGQWRRR